MTPFGLVRAERKHVRKVALLYALLAVVVLAGSAVLSQPRGTSPHPINETTRR